MTACGSSDNMSTPADFNPPLTTLALTPLEPPTPPPIPIPSNFVPKQGFQLYGYQVPGTPWPQAYLSKGKSCLHKNTIENNVDHTKMHLHKTSFSTLVLYSRRSFSRADSTERSRIAQLKFEATQASLTFCAPCFLQYGLTLTYNGIRRVRQLALGCESN